MKPRKSKAQLALESQEQFERARKSEKPARKAVDKIKIGPSVWSQEKKEYRSC